MGCAAVPQQHRGRAARGGSWKRAEPLNPALRSIGDQQDGAEESVWSLGHWLELEGAVGFERGQKWGLQNGLSGLMLGCLCCVPCASEGRCGAAPCCCSCCTECGLKKKEHKGEEIGLVLDFPTPGCGFCMFRVFAAAPGHCV